MNGWMDEGVTKMDEEIKNQKIQACSGCQTMKSHWWADWPS